MKIWIVNHYATLPDTAGGTRDFNFATELIRRGHRVSIFASGFTHRTRREERLETVKTGKNELLVLIYAGVLTVNRGVKEMLQALNCLEGRARLVLIGTFADHCLEKQTRVAAGDAVQIVGQVPYKKVFFHFEQCWYWVSLLSSYP